MLENLELSRSPQDKYSSQILEEGKRSVTVGYRHSYARSVNSTAPMLRGHSQQSDNYFVVAKVGEHQSRSFVSPQTSAELLHSMPACGEW
jgi:hypothetical protein